MRSDPAPAILEIEPVDPVLDRSWALDRHVLPKIALTFISIASMSGVYLTMTGHGASPGIALLRWVHLMAMGVLAGGTMWWGFFIRRPEEPEERRDVARFVLAQRALFRRIGLVALALAAPSAAHLAAMAGWARGAGAGAWLWGDVAILLPTLAAVAALLARSSGPEGAFSFGVVRAVCGALVVSLAATAALDARLTFPGSGSALGLRPLHLAAFGLWVGGAVWNIFIAVPAAQRTLSLPVVVAGARALERFRWVVRVILPTLVLTGAAQALPYTGFHLAGLTGSLFGRLILFKVALLAGLVVIFITCPLWRACSPIRGMCDLEELQRPPAPEPALRLDNRGSACAGFVHVRRALEALQPGAVLEVLSTDRFSWWELPAWLEVNGYALLEREKGWWRLRRSYRFLVRQEAAS
jgi:putative copper resistance protein D